MHLPADNVTSLRLFGESAVRFNVNSLWLRWTLSDFAENLGAFIVKPEQSVVTVEMELLAIFMCEICLYEMST